jgi:hypothetical protein
MGNCGPKSVGRSEQKESFSILREYEREREGSFTIVLEEKS